jgi:hypothetical protein
MRSPIRYAVYRVSRQMVRNYNRQHRRNIRNTYTNKPQNKKQVEPVNVGDSLFTFFLGVGLYVLLIRIITL